jgi:hypothetical protein
MKNKYFILTLIIVSTVVRLLIVFSFSPKRISIDSVMYHNYAVNIVRGNGYTAAVSEPFSENFFREPGNNYFIALAYKMSTFFQNEIDYIIPGEGRISDDYINAYRPEIYWARLLFALLELIAIIFFYKTLSLFLTRKNAFIISLIFSLFYPSFYFVVTLLRESLITSVFIILNYWVLKYLNTNKVKYLIVVGVLLGLLILTFQAMVVVSLVLVAIIYINNKKDFVKVIKHTAIVAILSLLTIAPWMNKIYNYYPDIRVFKTFGVSLTMEMSSCMTNARLLKHFGHITKEELNSYLNGLYSLDSHTQFENSINDKFKNQADSLHQTLIHLDNYSISKKYSYFAKEYLGSLLHFICPNYFTGIISIQKMKEAGILLKIIYVSMYLILFFICISGFVGVIYNYRIFKPFVFLYFSFVILLIIIPGFGAEGRRFLPMFSLWIPSSYLLIRSMIIYMKSKQDKLFFKWF